MKKLNIYRILPALVVIVLILTPAVKAGEKDPVTDFGQEIETVRAEFIQEKHLKILIKPVISRGVLYYKAPDSLRWEYRSPVRNVLLMHKNRVKRYTIGEEGPVEDAGANLQGMAIVMQEITSWMKGRFFDNPNFHAQRVGARRVVLIPKDTSLLKMIHKIEIHLTDRPGVIGSVTIFEDENSYTKLVFKNTELNQALEDSIFLEI
jgi:outer membrane lipoprotein-sorting protein